MLENLPNCDLLVECEYTLQQWGSKIFYESAPIAKEVCGRGQAKQMSDSFWAR